MAAVVCLLALVSALTPAHEATGPVVVCATRLEAGTQLAAEQLKLQDRPLTFIPDGALSSVNQAIGQTLVAARTPGSLLTSADLLSTGADAKPGMLLVPFRVPDAQIAALLHVGDRISVVSVTAEGVQTVLARGVQVVALPKSPPEANGLGTTSPGSLVVVAAEERVAAALAAAATQLPLAVLLG